MSSDEASSSGEEPPAKVAKKEKPGNSSCSHSSGVVVRRENTIYNRKMLAKLSCPVCRLPMEPPIFQCAKGHSYCEECEPKLQKCPLCFAKKTTIRNFALEGMTDDVYFPCRGTDCDAHYLLGKKINHQLECDERTVACFVIGCKWKGSFEALYAHVSEHPDSIQNVELDMFYAVIFTSSTSLFLKCNSRLFWVRVSMLGDSYGFCIMLYGTNTKASSYEFHVEMKSRIPSKKLTIHYESDMHCDLDHSAGCCITLFTRGSAAEKRILNQKESQFCLSFKITLKS